MRKIAVLFGGRSNEHDISVITGVFAVNLLRGEYDVLPVYLSKTGECFLAPKARKVEEFISPNFKKMIPVKIDKGGFSAVKGKRKYPVDCVLNCCHGGMGEDGTVSAVLRWNGVKTASPDTAFSSVFMRKSLSKIAAKGLGVPVLPSYCVREEEWKTRRAEVLIGAQAFGYPVIVKPDKLGSSIGITVAKTETELCAALVQAFLLDDTALVEEYHKEKRDINCAAYRVGEKIVCSPCEEVFSAEAFLSFGEKYERGERASCLPARIPKALSEEIAGHVKKLYAAFDGKGIVRADFLVIGDKAYFNEMNTVPGSLACYLFGETLTDAKRLFVSLIEEGCKEERVKEIVVTDLLDNRIFRGAKGCKNRKNDL